MKRIVIVIVLLAGAFTALAQHAVNREDIRPDAVQDGVAVFFSPNAFAMPAIIEKIRSAQRTIEIQAYLISSGDFADELIKAHKRGVKVAVVVDHEQAQMKWSKDEELGRAGIDLYRDKPATGGSNHNKVIIIDRTTVITGSLNFTVAAQDENFENVVMIHNKRRITDAYVKFFEARKAASKPYGGR